MMNKPELFAYTKRAVYDSAKTGAPLTNPNTFVKTAQETLARDSSHWESVYRTEVESNLKNEPIKSTRPVWSLQREAYSSKRAYHETEYSNSLGKYGQNPRDVLPHDSTKQANKVHELSMGTTKTTTHIPGYNGFIPRSDFNEKALEQSRLQDKNRATILKQNIVENYCVKLPGYQGHKPMSTINDRGTARPSCLNTEGESF
jgi:hypothetical protein